MTPVPPIHSELTPPLQPTQEGNDPQLSDFYVIEQRHIRASEF